MQYKIPEIVKRKFEKKFECENISKEENYEYEIENVE